MYGYTSGCTVLSMQCNIGRQPDRCPVTRRLSTLDTQHQPYSHIPQQGSSSFSVSICRREALFLWFYFQLPHRLLWFRLFLVPGRQLREDARWRGVMARFIANRQSFRVDRQVHPARRQSPRQPQTWPFSLRVRDPRWWPPRRSTIPFGVLDRSSTYDYPLRRAM